MAGPIPENPTDYLNQFLMDTQRWLHQRLTEHVDHHVWPREQPTPPRPPLPPTPPVPPAPPAPPPLPAPPAWAAAVAAPVAAATAPVGTGTGTSYSEQIADGIACLACTNGHLTAARVALDRAVAAATAGDTAGAKAQWAAAAAELDALAAIDWAPEKLARTPAADRAIVERTRACVAQVRAQVPLPSSVGTALGLAAEGPRFLVSGHVSARDEAEVTTRLLAIDEAGTAAERLDLIDRTDAAGRHARAALRDGRHALEQARLMGTWTDLDAWERARTAFQTAATALLPDPDRDQLAAAATACRTCLDQFRADFLATMQARRLAPPTPVRPVPAGPPAVAPAAPPARPRRDGR